LQITVHIQRRHFRLHEANFKIVGIERRQAEVRGPRAPFTYWMKVWRPGWRLPRILLPVIEELAQRRVMPLELAEVKDLRLVRWAVDTGREQVPEWIFPDWTPPAPTRKRPQVQDWRRRREPGGWPPPPAAER
jgi:hypothetical protein